MNVSSLQISLNHENIEIIFSGLESFTRQILVEHNALESFGYCGRGVYHNISCDLPDSSRHPTETCGILLDYITSSPQAEELFQIWNLSDIKDEKNKKL